jgi:hypothetical protein
VQDRGDDGDRDQEADEQQHRAYAHDRDGHAGGGRAHQQRRQHRADDRDEGQGPRGADHAAGRCGCAVPQRASDPGAVDDDERQPQCPTDDGRCHEAERRRRHDGPAHPGAAQGRTTPGDQGDDGGDRDDDDGQDEQHDAEQQHGRGERQHHGQAASNGRDAGQPAPERRPGRGLLAPACAAGDLDRAGQQRGGREQSHGSQRRGSLHVRQHTDPGGGHLAGRRQEVDLDTHQPADGVRDQHRSQQAEPVGEQHRDAQLRQRSTQAPAPRTRGDHPADAVTS